MSSLRRPRINRGCKARLYKMQCLFVLIVYSLVGRNELELPPVLKQARPTRMPPARKPIEMMAQRHPQHAEDPPYRLAKTEASDSFTFRRIRSSNCERFDVSE